MFEDGAIKFQLRQQLRKARLYLDRRPTYENSLHTVWHPFGRQCRLRGERAVRVAAGDATHREELQATTIFNLEIILRLLMRYSALAPVSLPCISGG